jgi:RNA polymerase sigma-70 factor (ECF subfamily)
MTQNQPPRLRVVTSQPAAPPNDGALLALVASGDLEALGRIYDSYAAPLLRFSRRLGARDDAEDVVQNVFLRVVRLAPKFDPSAISARSWLFAITARVIQERRRALRRLALAMSALSLQKGQRQPADAVGPRRGELDKCLLKLSHAKRSVVLLAELEGFSCAEIAKILGIPVGTVDAAAPRAPRAARRVG